MVKSSSKKIILIGLIVVLIACISTTVFADNVVSIISPNTGNTVANNENNTVTNNENNVVSNNETNIVTNNTSTNVSKYNATNTNTALPKTGDNDIYVVSVLVIVCGISAIYAYKKIRDYKA